MTIEDGGEIGSFLDCRHERQALLSIVKENALLVDKLREKCLESVDRGAAFWSTFPDSSAICGEGIMASGFFPTFPTQGL